MVDDFSHDFLSSMSLSKGKNRNVHDIALNNLSTSEIIEDRSFIRAARVFTPDPYGRQLLFHFISFHFMKTASMVDFLFSLPKVQ